MFPSIKLHHHRNPSPLFFFLRKPPPTRGVPRLRNLAMGGLLWSATGLSVLVLGLSASFFTGPQNQTSSTPPQESRVASAPQKTEPPKEQEVSYEKTRAACESFLSYSWDSQEPDADGVQAHVVEFTSMFAVADNPRIVNSAENLIDHLTLFGYALRTFDQESASFYSGLASSDNAALRAQCKDLLGR